MIELPCGMSVQFIFGILFTAPLLILGLAGLTPEQTELSLPLAKRLRLAVDLSLLTALVVWLLLWQTSLSLEAEHLLLGMHVTTLVATGINTALYLLCLTCGRVFQILRIIR